MTVPRFQEIAQYYIAQLRRGEWENAFHGLIESDPGVIHPLISAYKQEPTAKFRVQLLRIIREFRSPVALPVFEDALQSDRQSGLWRLSLDGLVDLGSPMAVDVIARALARERNLRKPDAEYVAWLAEAHEQIVEKIQLLRDDSDS